MRNNQSRKKAAVVYEDEGICELLSQLLDQMGYNTFSDSLRDPSLLRFLKRWRPNLVFIESTPPYESFIDVINDIRESLRETECHFVVLTTSIEKLESILPKDESLHLMSEPFTNEQIIRIENHSKGISTEREN